MKKQTPTPPPTDSLSNDDDIVERALLRLLFPGKLQALPPVETSYSKKMRRASVAAGQKNHDAEWIPLPARIFVHEILSAHTVSVSWSDSQTGHYAEQIWRLGLARNDGYCALSGLPIVEGNDVFRPRRSATGVPANWSRMILASAVPIERQFAVRETDHAI
ncbi:DUF3331 domain-containing protein [Paraburkholderia sp. C35]|uniref:DUF3331 domain-containing protein n=1 Tax=Paraburkholderia sp. C35 TaxID=2126993 RepID=UPI000D69913C|nr:DUF3331 domain-containing protein [Paraburkholderia sp. C35]